MRLSGALAHQEPGAWTGLEWAASSVVGIRESSEGSTNFFDRSAAEEAKGQCAGLGKLQPCERMGLRPAAQNLACTKPCVHKTLRPFVDAQNNFWDLRSEGLIKPESEEM